MRIQHAQQTRPDWYDRTPVARALAYAIDLVAPHAETTRWTYTVPAGKKFTLQIGTALLQVQAAGAGNASRFVTITYTPSGGAATRLFFVAYYGNTVGQGQSVPVGATAVLLPGDVLFGTTADASVGGTMVYAVTMQGLEFDA